MTRNHPELVQILEIFIYSENTGGEEQAGPSSSSFCIPDKDLFLPVDILKKLFNFFIVKTTQTFHKGINFILKDPIKSHLSIGSGAKNDLTRHAKSQNHMQLEMVQRKSKSMSLFVATPNNSLKSKTTSAETI
jgi:hypothetical protein